MYGGGALVAGVSDPAHVCVEDGFPAGVGDRAAVVGAAGQRVADGEQGAVQTGGDLDVEALPVSFAGVVLARAGPVAGRDVGAVDKNDPSGRLPARGGIAGKLPPAS